MKCKVRIYKVKDGDKEEILLSETEIVSDLHIVNPDDILEVDGATYKIVDKRFKLEDGELILAYKVH